MGGRDDADVHLVRPGTTQGANFALLKDAQQFGLQGDRHVADLIEKECAAIRGIEQALIIPVSATEGSLAIAEQFAFQQVFRQG
ncbi:hypothetical protein D9M70_632850 [compost metagenome]